MGGYAHLHVASGYSARYGAAHPEQTRGRGRRARHGHAGADRPGHRGRRGALREGRRRRRRPARPRRRPRRRPVASRLRPPDPAAGRRTPDRGGAHVVEPPLRIALLAGTGRGWARLCRMVSAAHARGAARGRSGGAAGGGRRWDELREHAGAGLTVLLGPVSEPGAGAGRRSAGPRGAAARSVAGGVRDGAAAGGRVVRAARHRARARCAWPPAPSRSPTRSGSRRC